MSYLWAQVIAQSIRDLQSGTITDARDAYNFLFSSDEDLKFVCDCAGLNHEIVRAKAASITLPKSVLPKAKAPEPEPEIVEERPCREPKQKRELLPNGPKVLGELAYQRLQYRKRLEWNLARKKVYYLANAEVCRQRNRDYRAAQKVSA